MKSSLLFIITIGFATLSAEQACAMALARAMGLASTAPEATLGAASPPTIVVRRQKIARKSSLSQSSGATAPVSEQKSESSDNPAPSETAQAPSGDLPSAVQAVQDFNQGKKATDPATSACPEQRTFLQRIGDGVSGLIRRFGNTMKSAFSAVKSFLTKRGHKEELVEWNECVQPITSNYNETPAKPTKCAKRMLAKPLADKLNLHLSACVHKAAGQVFKTTNFEGFNIGHMGVSPDSNHSQRSLHALGRALDLNYIEFKADGQARKLTYLDASKAFRLAKRNGSDPMQDPTFAFFKVFENCWNETTPPRGAAINCTDKNHQDHLHLSVPLDPNPGFFVK